MRSRVNAKLPIARAAMPMFSPSCGSTRITMGPARATPDLVLSVPDPDISFHFLIQRRAALKTAGQRLAHRLPQPAMARVLVEARMPGLRYDDFGCLHRQIEMDDGEAALLRGPSDPQRHGSDHVGGRRDQKCHVKVWNDELHLPRQ